MSIYRLLATYQVVGVCGEKGAGKSFIATELAIGLAEFKNYRLRFNFPVSEMALYKYAIACRYWNLYHRILDNDWGDCDSSTKIEEFLHADKGTIFVIDEASTLGLNTRSWRDLSMQALGRFAWARKERSHIIWTAQAYQDIDTQVCRQTELVVQAFGERQYDDDLDMPRLEKKNYQCYRKRDYEALLKKDILESSNFKYSILRKRMQKFSFKAPVDDIDLKLFDVFASDYTPSPTDPPKVCHRLKANQEKYDAALSAANSIFDLPLEDKFNGN